VVDSTTLPIIATNRQYEQGGFSQTEENQRIQLLNQVLDFGFRYVDLELTTPHLKEHIREFKKKDKKIIVSFHNFEETLDMSKLENVIMSQINAGADICKLVTTANKMEDNITCLLLTLKMSKIIDAVCFAMGKKGILSRVLSPIFGASFTYASVEKGLETALGQVSISDLKKIYMNLGVSI
jgi:3-dehydroquinate dehydratase type I